MPDPVDMETSLRYVYAERKYPHVCTLSISTDQNQSTEVRIVYTFQHKEYNLQSYHRA